MRKNTALLVIALLLLTPLALPVTAQNQGKQTTDQSRRADVQRDVENEGQAEGDAEEDADLRSPAGTKPTMSRVEYMQKREEAINQLRGLPLPEGVSSNVRVNAIQKMQQQEVQLRQPQMGENGTVIGGPQINSTSWTQIGPFPIPDGQTTATRNPVSGRVTSIAIHPTNPNIVYVGTAQGGLYRTLDGGTSWVPLMDNALTLVIGAVAIDPNNPTTVFVGTGEGNGFAGGQFFGVGLYRIRNADTIPVLEGPFNTATNTSTGTLSNGRSITKILVNPNDSNVIFVSTGSGTGGQFQSGAVGIGNPQRGIFRSVNAQAANPTFQKLNLGGATGTGTNPGGNLVVSDMEFEPGNPNNLLAGVTDTIGTGNDGVWRSTNALAADNTTVSFTKTLAGTCGFCNTQLAISKLASVVTVYAALESAGGGEVRKSIDGGVTWSPTLPTSIGFCGTQCFYDMPIAVDPTNPNLVMMGGSGDYDANQTPNKRSVDGTNFVKSSVGLHPDSHAIEFAPSNTLVAYHGNDGGIFKSTDGGATWVSINTQGFSATQFIDISTHPTDRTFMIGGTQDNGTPFLQPENTWKLGDFGDGGFSLIDQNAIDTVNVTSYHTYFNSAGVQVLFVRANNRSEIDPGPLGWPTYHGCLSGSSNNGISCTDAVLFYAPMAQGPGNPNTIYFGAQHLFRSANRGDTMPAVSQLFNGQVSAIGISPQNDNVRIVGLVNGGLFGTSTGANPMVNLDPSNTVPNVWISRAIIDPNNPTTAYVTLIPYGLAAGAHVYKTTNLGDAGTTWTLSGTGIPDVPTNTIVVDPYNSNNVYAGTDIGVYRSTNAGATWQPFSEGLPRVAVFDMEFQARSNPNVRVLRIATHGRGIWQISIDPVQRKRGDFDTDGKTDVAIWNSSTGQWFIYNSMGNFTRTEPNWGSAAAGDIAVPRDYDGDNKVDVAVFRTSEANWYLLWSSKNVVSRTPIVRAWGAPGDIPVPGDYDGDGKADLATFRPSEGNWYILNSSNNSQTVRQWGNSADRVVPADYDKDGKTDIAVFRPSSGHWYIINSSNGSVTIQQWGNSADKQVPADYDGDGKDDIAVFRPSDTTWYIINSSNGSFRVQSFGNATDVPVPGDYDGDGLNDLATYRPSDGNWHILQSSTNTERVQNLAGTRPVPASYLPN